MDEFAETQGNAVVIINAITDGIVITTGAGEIIYANPAAVRMLGKAGGVIGTRIDLPETPGPSEISLKLDATRTITLEVRAAEITWQESPGFIITLRDITTEKEEAEKVRVLSKRLIEAQEKERRDIGHELHDEVGGLLTAIKLELGRARKKLDESAASELERMNALLDEVMDVVSNLSQKMRPDILTEYGLLEALKWHFERFTSQSGVRVRFDTNLQDSRFAGTIETIVYRIIQEALTNVARHAGTDRVSVRVFSGEETLHIEVEDAGCGFDAAKVKATSGGIADMQDRAYLAGGDLFVDSSPGMGTKVTCNLLVSGT